ncbi:MAG: hypothetical protein SF066_09645 [Thermoanaerobaculia bacterium]|nr:hypothetical protein [Thermoanaerobaculia bacterium]
MLDVTPEDISQLTDSDLRELIGRLCEAEVASRGHSTAHVTWGGNQTAADGGIDARVSLEPGSSIKGFIPRPSTGFQVKQPKMPRAKIIREMRPKGELRPAIRRLASETGAYIVVSSSDSTTGTALEDRLKALREALGGLDSADSLYTDFYDQGRVATWVRAHPGLVAWVRRRVGRSLRGWQPYGSWSGSQEGLKEEYLWDDQVRVHLDPRHNSRPLPMVEAIDSVRDDLATPRKVVRLVGLSGVGKTRFAQALFEAQIGLRPLPQSLALYTNLSDSPEPQPIALASDLIAKRTRAVLIIDNSPADLHQRLSEICGGPDSSLSVLTIEYDVREDHPENTSVVRLDTSSLDLIVKLVRRRYPQVSQVDARTIADFSGGNARIAITLAETIRPSATIKGLTNEELFRRLFHQRHEPDKPLYLAAQACSLVYSFQGEALEGEDSEIPRLAALAAQTPLECFRHIADLSQRQLVQSRGPWRAVLPHAIANRLAASALESIHYSIIDQQLVSHGTERLARSFSRRLSFLHDHPKAVSIVESWLAPEGLLGNVSTLNEAQQAMFNNVAPVSPEAALAALERATDAMSWGRYAALLASLAYDASLFPRAARLLAGAAVRGLDQQAFTSLFSLHFSGTHAGFNDRLAVVEELLTAESEKQRQAGLAALERVLDTRWHPSIRSFEFGARSRDYGYRPKNQAEVVHWFSAGLALVKRLAEEQELVRHGLRQVLARKFGALWISVPIHDELEAVARKFGHEEFWPDGWMACRETLRFERDNLPLDLLERLSALEAELRPRSLLEQVQGSVLRDPGAVTFDHAGSQEDQLDAEARELGRLVAEEEQGLFDEILPELLSGESRVSQFGRGLAFASSAVVSFLWNRAVEEFAHVEPARRRISLFWGMLAELWNRDGDLAHLLLDEVSSQAHMLPFLPSLESALPLDERGIKRLKKALTEERMPVSEFRALASGRATQSVSGDVLAQLLLPLAEKLSGYEAALEIFCKRLRQDRIANRGHDPGLLHLGRALLQRLVYPSNDAFRDQRLAEVARACLGNPEGEEVAFIVAGRLRNALKASQTHSPENDHLLRALLTVQPVCTLDALAEGDQDAVEAGIEAFAVLDTDPSPADVLSAETLNCWCRGDHSRYLFAASIVPFACQSGSSGEPVWSEQAKTLLANAPDQKRVLEVFIERFEPTSYGGSLAEILARNAVLLESVAPLVDVDVADFLRAEGSRLATAIAAARQEELEWERGRNETFE